MAKLITRKLSLSIERDPFSAKNQTL